LFLQQLKVGERCEINLDGYLDTRCRLGGIAMSFLTDSEASSLRIARMSLHIVSDDEFKPEPELTIERDDFLLDRIRDIASASVYRFDDISTTRDTIEAIATREVGFEDGAQTLAREFCRFHRGGTRDGAFFVFELGVDDERVTAEPCAGDFDSPCVHRPKGVSPPVAPRPQGSAPSRLTCTAPWTTFRRSIARHGSRSAPEAP
jgi:hypothetical protein